MINVHTLAFNLVSEVEKATKSLYHLNDDFHHIIVDLGFPLEKGDEIPKDIRKAKLRNSRKLKALAKKYGSEYVKLPNIGVSQNWTAVYNHLNMKDGDVLIGADPDERPLQKGWVKAMATVLESGISMASLTMPNQITSNSVINGIRVAIIQGSSQWALIGFRKEFIDYMGEIPYPENAQRYGWIEAEVSQYFSGQYKMAFLTDYTVIHTDYELDHSVGSKLLREWKNLIIFQLNKYGQISFEEYLERRDEITST